MPTFSARPLWLACLLLTVPGLRAAAPPWDLQTRPLVERSADGHVNLELDLPVLAGPDRPAVRDALNRALRRALEAGRRLREARARARSHQRRAGRSAGPDERPDFPYHCRGTFELGTFDQERLSLCFRTGGFTGGSTGFEQWRGCTYSVATGRALALEDLYGPDWRARLRPLLLEALRPGAADLFEDWEARLDQARPGFFLRPGALVVFFPKYELAPGARGIVTAALPLPLR